MKCIINCTAHKRNWTSEFFEGISPYMLPVLGKPVIEFYLEYAALSGISKVLVVHEEYCDETHKFLENGARWGLDISIVAGRSSDSIEEMLSHNANFLGDDNILLLNGYFFPFYDKNADRLSGPDPAWKHIRLIRGSNPQPIEIHSERDDTKIGKDISPTEEIFCSLPPCKEFALSDIRDYFSANVDILRKGTNGLSMRGYGVEKGVFMGMNDIVQRLARLEAPFILGDNCSISDRAEISDAAIIGNNCIIDAGTHIRQSVVFDKTYIGTDLDIHGKILSGNCMVDPENGVKIMFTDNSFTAPVYRASISGFLRHYLFSVPAAILLCSAMAIPYFLYYLIGRPKCNIAILPRGFQKKTPCKCFIRGRGRKNSWFFKLSLDKFNPLLLVIIGRIKFVGDTLRIHGETSGSSRGGYSPGAFSYADSLNHENEVEVEMDDLFYKHNNNIFTDMQLVFRSLVSRLLKGGR